MCYCQLLCCVVLSAVTVRVVLLLVLQEELKIPAAYALTKGVTFSRNERAEETVAKVAKVLARRFVVQPVPKPHEDEASHEVDRKLDDRQCGIAEPAFDSTANPRC